MLAPMTPFGGDRKFTTIGRKLEPAQPPLLIPLDERFPLLHGHLLSVSLPRGFYVLRIFF